MSLEHICTDVIQNASKISKSSPLNHTEETNKNPRQSFPYKFFERKKFSQTT